MICVLSHFSHVQLFVMLWTVTHQAPLPMGFLRKEILEWVAMLSSGDFPNPGIEPASPESPALAGRYFTPEPSGKPYFMICLIVITLFTGDRVI